MFKINLYKFQDKHEKNLLKKCADYNEIILDAPTGSGKTVLCCKFIDDYLDENPDTVFLWLCPGAGSLQSQSQDVFDRVTSEIPSGDVYSFISDSNPRGKVFFINWDKINRNSNTVLQEGEHNDLMSKVKFCHENRIPIFMIIDEEHKYRDTANAYIINIQPIHVLRVSATPVSNDSCEVEKITDSEVISAGLIASGISINEGVTNAIQNNDNLDNDLLLLHLADEKRIDVQKEYEKLGLKIRPLVLIQFPNGSEEWIKRVSNELTNMGYSENSGMTTSWFSGDHPDNVEELKKIDGQYGFILFKQAISTGWDCPRAKILVKLREGTSDAFKIQTIGRIRRMPEGKHYKNELLDNCYVYTLDQEFEEGLTNSMSDSFYLYPYNLKHSVPYFILKKEFLNGSDKYAVNPKEVVNKIKEAVLEECDINNNGIIDNDELNENFIFSTKLKTSAFEGVARTTHDILSLNRIFGGEHEINNHDDGFIIRDAKRRIASSIGIDEHISNNALKILFGPEDNQNLSLFSQEEIDFEHNNKLIKGMSLRQYNAFLINNRDKLIGIFKKVNQEDFADIEETEIVEKDWFIPNVQYYKHHKKIASTKIMEKNVYSDYGNNILISPNRTYTEIEFEKWCEQQKQVKFLYKNGDKGEDYFTLVYRVSFRRYNFYPDYIIQLENGDIWIIEAKGGINSGGGSNNIDSYAKNKFEALKQYANKYKNIHWGFIRAVGSQIYFSNTEWDEDVTNQKVWKPIEDFVKVK